MNLHSLALAASLAVLGVAPAHAVTYTYVGDTTTAPTFSRPFFDFSGLSGAGQNARYQALQFTVSAAGTYDFNSVASGWDNFLFLYSPSFGAGSPLLNGLVGNDDRGAVGTAGFVRTLAAGVNYVLVTTGFDGPTDFGAYRNTIDGPGSVSVVPEPSTYALFALGLLALSAQALRKPRLRTLAS